MKKHISIFALLLSAFVAVGFVSRSFGENIYVVSSHPCSISDGPSSYSFSTFGEHSAGYYPSNACWDHYGLMDLTDAEGYDKFTASEESGLRFKGWYSRKSGWSSSDWPKVSEAADLVSEPGSRSVSIKAIKSKAGLYDAPLVFARYVPIYDVTTSASPSSAAKSISGAGTYEEGEKVLLKAEAEEGYLLAGWTFGGKIVSETNFSFTASKDTQGAYSAVFTGKVYRVTLNDGGTTGHPAEGGQGFVMAQYGQPMPTLDQVPSLYGWTFDGYFSETGGQGTRYYNADRTSAHVWEKTSGDTIYANWTPEMAPLHLTLNEGVAALCYRTGELNNWTTNTASATVQIQVGTVVHAYGIPKPGYEIDEGSIEKQWEHQIVRDSNTFAPVATKAAERFTVTFVDPTGANEPVSTTVTEGSAIAAPEWARVGYALSWNPNDFSPVLRSQEVTAVWTPIPYLVRFEKNEGTGTMADMNALYGQAFALAPNEFTNEPLFFDHWTTSVDTVNYPDCAVVSNLTTTANATNTFYAVWKEHHYTIRFNANGGEGTMDDLPFTYGETKKLTKNAFSRTGWHFVQWNDRATGMTYGDEVEVSNLTAVDEGIVNLDAVWSNLIDNPYSIAADCAATTETEMSIDLTTDNANWCRVVTNSAAAYLSGNDQYIELRVKKEDKAGQKLDVSLSGKALADGLLSFCFQLKREDDSFRDTYIETRINGILCFAETNNVVQWVVSPELSLARGDEFVFKFTTSQGSLDEGDDDYALIDYIKFTTGGGETHPEPEDGKDNVTISSAAVSDGKFTLSFASDERFDYSLLTNANLLIDSWGVMETKEGTGAPIVFEPEIVPGLPQLFYKVETIQKK